MTAIKQQIQINATPERCYQALTAYEQYPQFLPMIHSVQVLRREEGFSLVTFELDILMRVKYTLRIIEEGQSGIHWILEGSNVLTANNGGWHFVPNQEGGTTATYDLDIKFKGQLPGNVTNTLLEKTLPLAMESCKTHIEQTAIFP